MVSWGLKEILLDLEIILWVQVVFNDQDKIELVQITQEQYLVEVT